MSVRDEFKEKVAAIMKAAARAEPEYFGYAKGFGVLLDPFIDRILSIQVSGHRLLIGKVGAELPEWEKLLWSYRVADKSLDVDSEVQEDFNGIIQPIYLKEFMTEYLKRLANYVEEAKGE